MAILNDKFVRTVARDFAKRLIETNGNDNEAIVSNSFELSFARPPSETELEAAVGFVQAQFEARERRNETDSRREAIADYCHSLFGLNEFIYVD